MLIKVADLVGDAAHRPESDGWGFDVNLNGKGQRWTVVVHPCPTLRRHGGSKAAACAVPAGVGGSARTLGLRGVLGFIQHERHHNSIDGQRTKKDGKEDSQPNGIIGGVRQLQDFPGELPGAATGNGGRPNCDLGPRQHCFGFGQRFRSWGWSVQEQRRECRGVLRWRLAL